ncbi:hypothetical protein ACFL2Q_11315 [Thermodesulfobacteriota bacterium]
MSEDKIKGQGIDFLGKYKCVRSTMEAPDYRILNWAHKMFKDKGMDASTKPGADGTKDVTGDLRVDINCSNVWSRPLTEKLKLPAPRFFQSQYLFDNLPPNAKNSKWPGKNDPDDPTPCPKFDEKPHFKTYASKWDPTTKRWEGTVPHPNYPRVDTIYDGITVMEEFRVGAGDIFILAPVDNPDTENFVEAKYYEKIGHPLGRDFQNLNETIWNSFGQHSGIIASAYNTKKNPGKYTFDIFESRLEGVGPKKAAMVLDPADGRVKITGVRDGEEEVDEFHLKGIHRPKYVECKKSRISDAPSTSPDPPPEDPLILNFNGKGIETVGVDAGFHFDHDGNGFMEATGWVAPGNGLLMRDVNGNDFLDSGAELFGDFTPLANGATATNGFEALAQYDTNDDGKIDSDDPIWEQLKIWEGNAYLTPAGGG